MSQYALLSSEWEPYKAEIRSLYLEQNWKLKNVMERMELKYGLRGTESQFKKRLSKWGFNQKYMKEEEWAYIGKEVEKRALEGKETDVYLSDRLISAKRVKTGLGRRQPHNIGIGTSSQERLTVGTPPPVVPCPTLCQPTTTPLFSFDMYKSFDFDMNADIEINFNDADVTWLFNQSNSPHILDMSPLPDNISNDNIYQHISIIETPVEAALFEPFGQDLFPYINLEFKVIENLPWFQLQKLIEQPGFLFANFVVNDIFNPLGSPSSPSANPLSRLSLNRTHLALDERHNILSGFLNSRSNDKIGSSVTQLTAHLLQLIPERKIGELHMKLQQLLDPSNKFPLFQLFEVALYFSSNNLLSKNQMDVFLRWIIQKKYDELLKSVLKLKTPTVCAFTSRILESAVRIVEPKFLSLLLRSSIDSRVLSGLNGGNLLRSIINSINMDDEDADFARYTELTEILLSNGADPNPPPFRNGECGTTLSYAVEMGNAEMVKLLVKSGADVNAESVWVVGPNTPLACAVQGEAIPIVLLLLDFGAKVDISYVEGDISALEWAAIKSGRLYKILLAKSEKLLECLHIPGILYAARVGHSSLSNYLKESNSLQEPQMRKMLECALSKAVLCDPSNHRVLEVLFEFGVDANTPTQVGEDPPLIEALHCGALETVNILVKAGADVNVQGALESACTNFDLLELLIDHGADLGTYGGEALKTASTGGKLECVALLIESGVDINARASDAGHPTALQAAVQNGDIKLVQFLIDRGADVNAPASLSKGRTALQGAALHGHVKMVRYLLSIGADVNATPAKFKGLTALEAAAKSHCSEHKKCQIFRLLLDEGALINRPEGEFRDQAAITTLHALIGNDNDELVRLAVTAGADVNRMTFGREGRTPLQLAAEKGKLGIVKLLLEHGAQVNSPPANNYGRTAIQAAASCEVPNSELVQLLLENGADVNAKPGIVGGITALQGAAIRGHVKVALMLLDAKANVNAQPAITEGRTVVEGAAEHGRLDMVQLLVDAGAVGDDGTGFEKAIKVAEKNNYFTIADILKEREVRVGRSPMN